MNVIKSVVTPDCDWGVFYLVNDLEDRKLWEGHEYMSNGFDAIVKALGADIEYWEFTDKDEVDGCTPDTFGSIKGKKRMH
jgi:hypothetical protein